MTPQIGPTHIVPNTLPAVKQLPRPLERFDHNGLLQRRSARIWRGGYVK
jgi:hypothetical protein